MKWLEHLPDILKAIPERAEFLPAVGGAAEDLERPDVEEREDQLINSEERIFQAIFEHDPACQPIPRYRSVTPLPRGEKHLLRYFLDGSLRSYFLGTILENERDSPLHFAQIGACVVHRKDDGSVQREKISIKHLLMAAKQRLSENLWGELENRARSAGIEMVDLTEKDIFSDTVPDGDLRSKAGGKVRFEMRTLEAEIAEEILSKLSGDCWLAMDGSLLFNPILTRLSNAPQARFVIGVSKNFRKDPQFVFGRGQAAQRLSIYKFLADLQAEQRTAAFSSQGGKIVFWYVRLREQTYLDYPLMGVVKVELMNPSSQPVPSPLIDEISRTLVAERRVAPHGQDPRWHALIYPICLAERAVKECLLSRESVQQFVRWRVSHGR